MKRLIDILIWTFGLLAFAGWTLGIMSTDEIMGDSLVVTWFSDRPAVILFGFLSAGICFLLFSFQYEEAAEDLFSPLWAQRFGGFIFTLFTLLFLLFHLLGAFPMGAMK